MNCTICKKPVDEHDYGIGTDRCVAVKILKAAGCDDIPSARQTPEYSHPTMSAETWGLVERMPLFLIMRRDKGWSVSYGRVVRTETAVAPTATLAIIRAFLAKEDK